MSLSSWKLFASRTAAIEKKYLPQVEKAIKKAYAAFIADLKEQGIERATANINAYSLNEDLIPVLTSIYTKAGLLGATMTYSELRKGMKSANIGRNESWIADVLNYLKLNLMNFAAKISETTREDILKIVSKGVDQGWGAERIARELADSGFPLMRARVVVRTETIRAANTGHLIAGKSFPYEVMKKWSSSSDHRTRRSHMAINGTTIEEHELFKVPIYENNKLIGYDNMAAPGDANAHPSNCINCRCRVMMIPKRDSIGKLIPRRSNIPVTTIQSPVRSMVVG